MLDVNSLSVSQLIELVRLEQRAQEKRDADIRDLENEIFKMNSKIYEINRRGDRYRKDGSKYLQALNSAIGGINDAS